ncbi:PREDICTED: uncharacterized protein LOC108564085 [Nicrophorus vespilloides]|uniref:Uncharacterized protein LOC108564085 n=1 Tax=Nicrophorus vespilloides TaxID=110193 RepID=A0ABM1MV80_NICVS|nr:PREDICTED: uncharacterized protein LOC108564085 [Nicrophorus vespilloides]
MSSTKALVGAATRYIAGRNAVQTVYWRESKDSNKKMLKLSKNFNLGRSSSPPNHVRDQYNVVKFG